MANKMTKVEMINAIKAVVADHEDMVAFLDNELASIEKRAAANNARRAEKNSENVALLEKLIEVMPIGKDFTVKELRESYEDFSALSMQKIVSLFKSAIEDKTIRKDSYRGVTTYTRVE